MFTKIIGINFAKLNLLKLKVKIANFGIRQCGGEK